MIFDQFNIPSGPVLGVHLTTTPWIQKPVLSGLAWRKERAVGFGQAPSPEPNWEPGVRTFPCQRETSVPGACARSRLDPPESPGAHFPDLFQSLVRGLVGRRSSSIRNSPVLSSSSLHGRFLNPFRLAVRTRPSARERPRTLARRSVDLLRQGEGDPIILEVLHAPSAEKLADLLAQRIAADPAHARLLARYLK